MGDTELGRKKKHLGFNQDVNQMDFFVIFGGFRMLLVMFVSEFSQKTK